MIAAADIQAARAIRIQDELLRRGIKLRRVGSEMVGACPKCGGDDRFSINTKKQVWHCRHCKPDNITGDVIGLVQHLDGCDFAIAVRILVGNRSSTTTVRPTGKSKSPSDGDEVQS